MLRTACVIASLGGAAAQAAGWTQYVANVAALCEPPVGAQPPSFPLDLSNATIVQVAATKVRVQAPNNPDAVWLTDEYGTILAYQPAPTFSGNQIDPVANGIELDFGTDAGDLKLWAHHTSCFTASTSPVATWKKRYNDFISNDDATYSTDLTQAQIDGTAPNITISATGTATISFTQGADVPVPHAHVKDNTGLILAYRDEWASGPDQTENRQFTVAVPSAATSITACSLTCVTHELADDIALSLEAIPVPLGFLSTFEACATESCRLPTVFRDDVLS